MALLGPPRLRIPDHVVSEIIGGEAILLNLRSGLYFSLNRLGARVWTLLEQGMSTAEVRQLILVEYDVKEPELERDLDELIAQLLRSELLLESG